MNTIILRWKIEPSIKQMTSKVTDTQTVRFVGENHQKRLSYKNWVEKARKALQSLRRADNQCSLQGNTDAKMYGKVEIITQGKLF